MKRVGVSRRKFLETSVVTLGASHLARAQEEQRARAAAATLRLVSKVPIPKQSGRAVFVARERRDKVITPRGKEVGDFFALKREDRTSIRVRPTGRTGQAT